MYEFTYSISFKNCYPYCNSHRHVSSLCYHMRSRFALFSSRYLHYMFSATIIYSLLFLFSLNNVNVALHFIRIDGCLCVFFLGYIGCVCDIFLVRFFHLLLHLLPVKSESPKETISKICSLAFLSTAKNALNLEFSTLTPFSLVHFCVVLFCFFFFGNFTVIVMVVYVLQQESKLA